jgi:hypothetical protein
MPLHTVPRRGGKSDQATKRRLADVPEAGGIQLDAKHTDHEGETMAEGQGGECEALRTQIETLQKEFEGLWVSVSAGALPTPRYRELRREIDRLRAEYQRDCGTLVEDSSLPRHITSDWRAG